MSAAYEDQVRDHHRQLHAGTRADGSSVDTRTNCKPYVQYLQTQRTS